MSAEDVLLRREPLGWRLGLERMQRLCSLLGMPQRRFASIHVVGTNGKTSVARMSSALLETSGVAAGTYLSPHVHSWRERILLRGEPIDDDRFAAAIEHAAAAAEVADRAAGDEGPVTQFEIATAAAFHAFADARIEVAVVEAGLGGRLDATNVIPSRVAVLTSVGLDHTEWLGETLEEIAAEKLAVLRDHATLVTGRLSEPVARVAAEAAARHHARLVEAPTEPPPSLAGLGPPGYQRRNLAIAIAAVEAFLGELDPEAVRAAGARLEVPGRAEAHDGAPPVIFDAAHNADGAAALAGSLDELADGRLVVACVALLADKDAGAIASVLTMECAAIVCTEIPTNALIGSGRPGAESRSCEELAEIFRRAAPEGTEVEAVAEANRAWRRARELAAGIDGVALATGSHYLLSSIWTERPAESS